MRMMQGKGKHPLPLHPIPSNKRRTKCQGCARSKVSGILPAVQPRSAKSPTSRVIEKAKKGLNQGLSITQLPKTAEIVYELPKNRRNWGGTGLVELSHP